MPCCCLRLFCHISLSAVWIYWPWFVSSQRDLQLGIALISCCCIIAERQTGTLKLPYRKAFEMCKCLATCILTIYKSVGVAHDSKQQFASSHCYECGNDVEWIYQWLDDVHEHMHTPVMCDTALDCAVDKPTLVTTSPQDMFASSASSSIAFSVHDLKPPPPQKQLHANAIDMRGLEPLIEDEMVYNAFERGSSSNCWFGFSVPHPLWPPLTERLHGDPVAMCGLGSFTQDEIASDLGSSRGCSITFDFHHTKLEPQEKRPHTCADAMCGLGPFEADEMACTAFDSVSDSDCSITVSVEYPKWPPLKECLTANAVAVCGLGFSDGHEVDCDVLKSDCNLDCLSPTSHLTTQQIINLEEGTLQPVCAFDTRIPLLDHCTSVTADTEIKASFVHCASSSAEPTGAPIGCVLHKHLVDDDWCLHDLCELGWSIESNNCNHEKPATCTRVGICCTLPVF